MACERFAGALKDAVAGGEPTAALRAHLDECTACREALARQRSFLAGIEADLARELKVEPSANFEARVRERILSHEPARGWITGWRVALAAACATAALVVAVATVEWGSAPVPRPQPNVDTRAHLAPVPPSQTGETKAPGEVETTVASTETGGAARPATTAVRHARRPSGAPPREPEVLVAPDQQIAIGRLLVMARAAKVDESALEETPRSSQPPEAIVVGELTVSPIVVTPPTSEKQQ